jgi:predicted HicB family RNase H-like nuclease
MDGPSTPPSQIALTLYTCWWTLRCSKQVRDAAAAQGASGAAWVRQAIRQVTPEDFPASWHVGETAARSHESGYFHRKFGLRLDDKTSRKLEALTEAWERSAAEVVRQLIVQAAPEDLPESWRMAVEERPLQNIRPGDGPGEESNEHSRAS